MNAKPQVKAPTGIDAEAEDAALNRATRNAAIISSMASDAQPAAAVSAEARPLRRDAERNRQLILSAAKGLIARRGLDVSLDEVAKEAGLGVGTVYRRFPHRDALIDALFDDMVNAIKRIAEESVALPRAWDGLAHFMTAMLESQAQDKGLRDAALAQQKHLGEQGTEKSQAVRELVQPMLYALVERAKLEGDLRTDVAATDIGVLLITAVNLAEFTTPVAPENWRRQLTIILDGLRTRPDGTNSALAESPLDEEQFDACMAGWKYGTRGRT